VEVVGVFVGKFSSSPGKDHNELRVLTRQVDKAVLIRRLYDKVPRLLEPPRPRELAEGNGYILYGELLSP